MARKRRKTARRRNYQYRSYQTSSAEWLQAITPDLEPGVVREMVAVLLVGLGLFILLAIIGFAGTVGQYFYQALRVGFGWSSFILPLILVGSGTALFYPVQYRFTAATTWGLSILFIVLSGLLALTVPIENGLAVAYEGNAGGLLGYFVSYMLISIVDFWATLLILLVALIVTLSLVFGQPIREMLMRLRLQDIPRPNLRFADRGDNDDVKINEPKFERRKLPTIAEKLAARQSRAATEVKTNQMANIETGEFVPKYIQDEDWTPPPIDLLSDESTKVDAGNIEKNVSIIQETLENFGVEVQMAEVNVGPTVTQYTLKPSVGVKLAKITALNQDLALSLAAHPLRIEAPIPGRSLVGIEVPNKKSAVVRLRELLESPQFAKVDSHMAIPLGRDVAGLPLAANLDSMPHVLIAGATGSGKSVFLNSLLITLLYENSPSELRLILIDPKRVEFSTYNEIPHLLAPVIVEPHKAVNALKWLIGEMERRYKLFSDFKVRNLDDFNKLKTKDFGNLPSIVLIVDELADLMSVSAKEVESYIARLAQMARATGIHLVIATQRPSVDVVTGLIKANFPSRIAFAVTSGTDSRTILDTVGAEKLLGYGDMLYLPRDAGKPRRIQAVFVDDKEIKAVTQFLKDKRTPSYIDEVTIDQKGSGSSQAGGYEDEEPLFEDAVEEVLSTGKASASYLQRKFRIGYARAARLLDILEERGVIGPGQGAKPRDVLIDHEEWAQLQNGGEVEDSYVDPETGETFKEGEDY